MLITFLAFRRFLISCIAILPLGLFSSSGAQQDAYDGGIVVDHMGPEYTEGGPWEVTPGSYYLSGMNW